MCRGFVESHEHALPVCIPPPAPRPRPRTALRAVATQQWCHLPLIDGPRERLSSPGAIDGRLAPASDGRPANDRRLLAPPNETLARLLRCDSGRKAMPTGRAKRLPSNCLREGEESSGRLQRRESCATTPLLMQIDDRYHDLIVQVHRRTTKWRRRAARGRRKPTTTSA